jgi:hypothetical protein
MNRLGWNAEWRENFYKHVLGESDAATDPGKSPTSAIRKLGKALRDAAAAYRENEYKENYKAPVVTAAKALRGNLTQKTGCLLKERMQLAMRCFLKARAVLTNDAIINAFPGAGAGPERPGEWLKDGSDGGGARMVGAIAREIKKEQFSPGVFEMLDESEFSQLLDIAKAGRDTLNLLLVNDDFLRSDAELKKLSEGASNWGDALKAFWG